MSLDDFFKTVRGRHEQELTEGGHHDERCEWRPNGHYICNCAKRRRIAEGFTEEPGDLYFPPPACLRCYRDLDHDGDGWVCEPCHVAWDGDGTDARFTDDMGDDAELAESAARYDGKQAVPVSPISGSSDE